MNLTETSKMARKAIVGLISLVILAFITKIFIIPIGTQVMRTFFPPNDPANPIYGKLTSPVFDTKSVLDSEISYELDTKSGKLPTGIPNKMAVYRMDPPVFSYEGGKKAFATAKFLGFSETDLASDLKKTTYVWKNNTLGRQLEININNDNLYLRTDPKDKAGYFFTNPDFNEASAVKQATEFLIKTDRKVGELYEDGNKRVKFGRFSGKRIIDTNNPGSAEVALVDFYREINKVPIYGPDPDKGLISIVVGKTNTPSLMYLKADIKNFGVDSQSNATYPIVPVSQVWAAIKQNKGVIASVNPEERSDFEEYSPVKIGKVLISEIELAYYESRDPQKYLQPVYVFKGFYNSSSSKGSIAIYYPAISGEYIIQEESVEQ